MNRSRTHSISLDLGYLPAVKAAHRVEVACGVKCGDVRRHSQGRTAEAVTTVKEEVYKVQLQE